MTMKKLYVEPEMDIVCFEDGIACDPFIESDPGGYGPWAVIDDEEDM